MPDKPVLDIRTYTIRPRGVAEFLRLYEELALPIAIRHWGPPVAFYVSEIGPLNQVIHVWEFESLADMERCRAAIGNDAEFAKYLSATDGMIVAQEDRVVRRVKFKSLD
jgi:NIPSNAP